MPARRPGLSDLVERHCVASRPDALWVADVTYVPTWARFVYLAVVVDAFSRRVVGGSMATHLRTELVLEALNMALHEAIYQSLYAGARSTPSRAVACLRTGRALRVPRARASQRGRTYRRSC